MSQVNVASATQIVAVQSAIESLHRTVAAVGNEVKGVQANQVVMQDSLTALATRLEQYIAQDQMDKALQLAQTQVVAVRQELEKEFGHYDGVRRRATGILQAVDSGLVTHETVRSTTEDVVMSTPRYWLAAVLVAVAAWTRDERDLAERALGRALDLDQDKTALFFVVLCRRLGRQQAVASWLIPYLNRQDPLALKREFLVILDGVASGTFGLQSQQTTYEVIADWLEYFRSDPVRVEELVGRWKQALAAFAPPVESGKFPYLAQYSTDWPRLQRSLSAVGGHEVVRLHLQAIIDAPVVAAPNLTHQIDDLMTTLVSEFDEEELPLRREEQRLQAIITARGDEARAEAQLAVTEQALAERVPFPDLLTDAAILNSTTASPATRRFALGLAKDWIAQAHEEATVQVRAGRPLDAPVKVEAWDGTLGNPPDEAALVASVEAAAEAEGEARLAKLKTPTGSIVSGVLGGVLALILLFTGAWALALVVIAGAAGFAWFSYQRLLRERQKVVDETETRKTWYRQTILALVAEWVDYQRQWEARDQVAGAVRDVIDAIEVTQMTERSRDAARGAIL